MEKMQSIHESYLVASGRSKSEAKSFKEMRKIPEAKSEHEETLALSEKLSIDEEEADEQLPVSFRDLAAFYKPTWLVVVGLISSCIVSV